MSETAKTDAEMRYLLGNLTESERASMEEDFFADDSKFEALELAEEELIDAYVRNEFPPGDQLKFETTLLNSPRLRERVHFARTLSQKANSFFPLESEPSINPELSLTAQPPKEKTRWWTRFIPAQPVFGMSMAVSAILILVPGIFLASGWLRLRREADRIATEAASLQRRKEDLERQALEQRSQSDWQVAELQHQREQLAQDQKRFEDLKRTSETGKPSTLGSVVSFLLTPGGSRGSAGHDLVIGPEASTAKLQLALERNDYTRYSAVLETADGEPVISKPGLKARNGAVTLMVPTKLLRPDTYVVELRGINASGTLEPTGNYPFRVLKKQ